MTIILSIGVTVSAALLVYAIRLINRRERQNKAFARFEEVIAPPSIFYADVVTPQQIEEWRTSRWD